MTMFSADKLRCSMSDAYRHCMGQAVLIIVVVLALCAAALYYARTFSFDASADTLIAQNDPQLVYYQAFSKRFDQAPFLVMTYTPREGSLFDQRQLDNLQSLQQQLEALPGIKSVMSILDAPLLESPPIPLARMSSEFKTLRDPETDRAMAREELTTSPMFRELLISADGGTGMLAIQLQEDPAFTATRDARDRLRREHSAGKITDGRLERAERHYNERYEQYKTRRAEVIAAVRGIRDGMSDHARLYVGGAPMVAADMIEFVKADMRSFGAAVVILIALSLYAFFRRLRWVLMPLGATAVTILLMIGLLGFLGQPVTAISSNFIALLAIITISFTIHLISRYRELRHAGYSDSHTELVLETMRSKLAPCAYTGLTTVVAFASLLTSDIVPVVDFGWIMCAGVLVSLLITYSFFASILLLLPKGEAATTLGRTWRLTRLLEYLSIHHGNALLIVAGVSLVAGIYGVSKLELGNRFTDYFRNGTEIHDGMVFIDKHLGGTIPLDVVIRFPPFTGPAQGFVDSESGDDSDVFAVDGMADSYPQRYWYTPEKIASVARLHDYLERREEIGKVVSLASLETVARKFNDGKPLDYLKLTSVLGLVPEDIRNRLITPYASPESGELRISARLHETGPDFSRDQLLRDIHDFAINDMGLAPGDVRITGLAVLFNDMLKQLLGSQTSTLLFVILAVFLMFAALLRSASLAIIGLFPNLLAALSILAIMGWLGVPLDMMTITIAAIVIGIGVDDAIHFLHRFKEELASGKDARTAVKACHASIGHALYFTSITVVIGFSVLGFSNFVPTVYFGGLTALAMIMALFANLTLLPVLLLKRYG